jgi:hypothetical protein
VKVFFIVLSTVIFRSLRDSEKSMYNKLSI